jgi:hypothetical protein
VAGTGQVRSTRERIQRALRSRHARPGCRPMVRGKGGRQLYKKKSGREGRGADRVQYFSCRILPILGPRHQSHRDLLYI